MFSQEWLPPASHIILRPLLNVPWLPPTSDTTILRLLLNMPWLPLTSDIIQRPRPAEAAPNSRYYPAPASAEAAPDI
jgi:hypothetical protein